MANRAKPSFPQLNRSHPLAQGLVFDMPIFEGSGNKANELAALTDGAITGASFVNTQYGPGLSFRGDTVNSDRVVIGSKPLQNGLNQMTVETIMYMTGYGTFGQLFRKGGASKKWLSHEFDSGVPFKLRIGAQFSTTSGVWDVAISLNQWNHTICTYDGSSTANNPSMDINGVGVTVTRTVGPSGTRITDDSNLYVGNANSSTNAFQGIIALTRYWNRILSAEERAQLHADPFQIYAKKPAFAQFAAAGIPAPGGIVSAYRTLMGVGV